MRPTHTFDHSRRLAIVPIRGEPCELEVPTSTSASELEALVSKHEGTPVGKWKMSLQPLPSAAPRMPQISEIRDEVKMAHALACSRARRSLPISILPFYARAHYQCDLSSLSVFTCTIGGQRPRVAHEA